MTRNNQALFWLAAFGLLFLVLALIGDILLPFIVGAALAYFLDPLADRLERLGLTRFWATVVIVAIFGVLIVLAGLFILPLVLDQLVELVGRVPAYVQSLRELASGTLKSWLGDNWIADRSGIENTIRELAQKATGWIGQILSSIWTGGLALVNFIALLVVTPVVTFYLLLDWDRMVQRISDWLPRDHADTIRGIAREIDDVLAGFVRGQVTVLLILGAFYVFGLTVIGLNFGLLIGVVAGLISFIPFVGPVVGLIIGGSVAVVQFWPDWHWVVAVLSVFMIGQAVEGNILSPMIVGDRVRLHPVWLIFALFVFGYLFGFVGMLLAVPLAAAIGVLVRFALRVYLHSPLYLGEAVVERRIRRRKAKRRS